MAENKVLEFTNRINSLLPLDSVEKISSLIQLVAKQIKKSTFTFSLDKLEADLFDWTADDLRPQLTQFFGRAKANVRDKHASSSLTKRTGKEKKKQRDRKKHKTVKRESPSTKSVTKIQGVPEAIIRKSIKNEEKRQKRSLTKKHVTSGRPKRNQRSQERIFIGIYKPGFGHSETEEDPIHRK